MICADFHTHTTFSTDGTGAPEDMLRQAAALGLKYYCFTDHMDYDFPGEEGAFTFSPEEYFSALLPLKRRYAGRLTVSVGVELGLRNEPELLNAMPKRCEALLSAYPFDFVIGSTHVLQYEDPYEPSFWERRSPEEGVRLYLESILDNARAYDGFQVYGHLDYILRYLPQGAQVDMRRFRDLYDAILKQLLAKGMGIELNTANYARGASEPHPEAWVLSRYRELGGELLTIGSDAHRPERIAYDFARAEKLLLRLGYRYYATFSEKKPDFHRLGEV